MLAGFSPIYYVMYTGGVAPMLWSTVVAYSAYLLPSYRFDLGPWIGSVLNSGQDISITLEVAGASNSDWIVSGVLLLMRSGHEGQVVSSSSPVYVVNHAPEQLPISSCMGANLSASGVCKLRVEGRELHVTGRMRMESGRELHSSVTYSVDVYRNIITYNSTESSYEQLCNHSASWVSTWHGQGSASRFLEDENISYQWLNSGEVRAGGLWLNSYNFTERRRGKAAGVRGQEHYQRLFMLDPSNEVCLVPDDITHTVRLKAYDVLDMLHMNAFASWAAVNHTTDVQMGFL